MKKHKKDTNNYPFFGTENPNNDYVHLPVAYRCNVQCNFCNRQFDCINENQSGTASTVLSPSDALKYLEEIKKKGRHFAAIGIDGPGDPFANPKETMETLKQVRNHYPNKLLCVSSNGLNITEYIPRLIELKVFHATITVNAINPKIGAQIYEWIYFNKKSYFGEEGANLLLQQQTEAIQSLKQHGLNVQINTIVIPRVNQHHIPEIAWYVKKLGADIQCCIPFTPVAGTPFEHIHKPSDASMLAIKAKISIYREQMTRYYPINLPSSLQEIDQSSIQSPISFETKPNIAIATTNGILVDQHLGRADYLWIYGLYEGKVKLIEKRSIINCHQSNDRWNNIADVISDCAVLLVNALGQTPLKVLRNRGFIIEAVEGKISEITDTLLNTGSIPEKYLRLTGNCPTGETK